MSNQIKLTAPPVSFEKGKGAALKVFPSYKVDKKLENLNKISISTSPVFKVANMSKTTPLPPENLG